MRPGGSKQKGAQFERDVCRALSLWLSKGESDALFWRSAMSGGRATLGYKVGQARATQVGDMSAVAQAGHDLTDTFSIECKFYANIGLESFLLKDAGPLANFWEQARRDAIRSAKDAMLVVKQNKTETLLVMSVVASKQRFTSAPLPLFTLNRRPVVGVWSFASFLEEAVL